MSSPRARRWFRPRNIVLAVAAVAALWIARETWWFVTAQPAPVVNYAERMQSLCESHQPAGRDGWDLYRAASTKTMEVRNTIAEIDDDPDEERPHGQAYRLDFDAVNRGALDFDLLAPELRALQLLRESGVNDLLADAATCPRAVRPLSGDSPLIINIQLTELSEFRLLTTARLASMRIAAESGDEAERLAAFEQTLAVARICASQSFLIDRLVAISIANRAFEELSYEIAERPIDEGTALAFAGAMNRQLRFPPMSLPYEAERLSTLDMIQYLFSDDGHGDGRIDLNRFNQMQGMWGMPVPGGGSVLGRIGAVFLPGRAETTALCEEYYAGVIGNSRLGPVARAKSGFDGDAFVQQLSARHLFLNMMLPAISAAMRQNDSYETSAAAMRVMLAIEVFRARRGRPPADLAELAAEALPVELLPPGGALPVDPMNGGAFGYRLNGEANARWPYLLYSIGEDGIDDIAAAGEDYEDVVNPGGRTSRSGMDVLFTRTRPEREH